MIKKDVSAGITGFIDILGFGQKVASSTSFSDIESIVKKLQIVQKEFEYENNPNRSLTNLPTKSVLAFSDCIVINIPFESESTDYTGIFDGFMFEFSRMALAQIRCIEHSIFLRGGIDIGWWYNKKDIVVSDSLVKAYSLENKIKFPVIGISDKLYDYLLQSPDFLSDYGNNPEIIESIICSMTYKNNRFQFINYLEITLDSVNWQTDQEQIKKFRQSTNPSKRDKIRQDGYAQNVKWVLETHSKKIKEAFQESEDDRVKEKYLWLAKYHNDVVRRHSQDDECLCDIK